MGAEQCLSSLAGGSICVLSEGYRWEEEDLNDSELMLGSPLMEHITA